MPVDIRQIEEVLNSDVSNSAFMRSLDQRYIRAANGGGNLSFISDTAVAYSDTPGVSMEQSPLKEQEYYVHLTLPSGLKDISEKFESLGGDLTYAFQKISSLESPDITIEGNGVDTSGTLAAGVHVTKDNGVYYLKLSLPQSLTDNSGKTISFTNGSVHYVDSASQGTEVVTTGSGAYQVNITLPSDVTVVSTGSGDSTVALAKGRTSTVSNYVDAGVTPRLEGNVYYLDLVVPVQTDGGTSGGAVALAKGVVDYGSNVGVNPRRSGDTFYLDLTLPVQTPSSGGISGSYVKSIGYQLDKFAAQPDVKISDVNGDYTLNLSIPSFAAGTTTPLYTSSLTADVLCWKELTSDADLATVEDGLSLVKFPSSGINYYGYWMKKGNVGGGYFINDDSKLVAGHATRDGGWQKASQILDEHSYQDIIFGAPKDTASGITLNTLTGYNSYVTKVNNLDAGKTIALSGTYSGKSFTGGLLKLGPGIGIGVIEYNGHAIPIASHGSHVEIPAPFETVMQVLQSGGGTSNANLKMAIQKQGEAIQKLGEAVHYSNAALRQISNTYPALYISSFVSTAESRLSDATTLFAQAKNYFAAAK